MSAAPREWNAAAYHRVGNPQFEWAMRLLDRLTLRGDERVLDAGCGSGRVTEKLLERLPRGRVVAVDGSRDMLDRARDHLAPRFGERVTFLHADLADLRLPQPVDVVFSAAVFHWIPDHGRLFGALWRVLGPGGRLHAQCGGGPNLARFRGRATALMAREDFAPRFAGWIEPWFFPGSEETAERLLRAGFVAVETGLEEAPTRFPDADAYRAFLETVVCPGYLDRLDATQGGRFVEALVQAAGSDQPPWSLDYVRLNLGGRRPLA